MFLSQSDINVHEQDLLRGNRLERSRNIRVKAAGTSRALRPSRTSNPSQAVMNIAEEDRNID